MEHRWGQRSAVDFPVRLTCDPYATGRRARLLNVSVSGAFVATALRPPLLAGIQLDIDLPGRAAADRPLRIGAYVVRRSTGGFAVEWHELLSDRLASALITVRGAKMRRPFTADSVALRRLGSRPRNRLRG